MNSRGILRPTPLVRNTSASKVCNTVLLSTMVRCTRYLAAGLLKRMEVEVADSTREPSSTTDSNKHDHEHYLAHGT